MTLQMCEDPQTKKMTCIESSAHKDNLLLDAQDLRTYFFTTQGIIKAVDGVSFHIKRGETLSLVGESGCGKTCTCLSVIRLIPEPQGRIVGGSIFFKGENLLEKSKREMKQIRGREISMIFQDPMSSLNPVFTIGNQVAEAIRVHQPLKGRRLIERVIEVLKLVHIPSPQLRRHDYPHQMSGGMRQRVSGAIALSPEPSLIIADEPTTSLDVTTQAQYLELLENIQKS